MAGVRGKGTLLRPWLRALEQHTHRSVVPRRGGQPRRGFFGGFGSDIPADPQGQARYLRDLNRRGDPEAVIRSFESGQLTVTDATLSEYVKALVKVDRLDGTQLLRTLQRGATTAGGQSYAAPRVQVPSAAPTFASAAAFESAAAAPPAAPLAAAGMVPGATEKFPMYFQQVEPSFRTQFWRTVRWLAGAFFIISGINVLFEERGLARGVLNNPDLRPQIETKTKFADVKGVDEAKAELEEIVEFLRNPSRFTALGGKLPKGVLLVGPPGTGKTMLARAIAGEAGVPFFYCSGSEFEEMFVGVGARRVRDLFAAAKKTAPCIVFIDEIDAIGSSRNPKDQQYMKMTLNQLLVELDGFKPSEGVIVVAATNFPQSLDKALVRPGRFDRHVVVPNPDVKGRQQILEVHFKNIPRSKNVDLSIIARGTPGFSGADLANLVNLAALKAAQDGQSTVDMNALEYARERIIMGAERKGAVLSEKTRRNTAYHEGGHAIVALLTPGADPVHKATIIPRGMALGMVTQLPDEDQVSLTKKQLLARLNVLMGGKAAEELIEGVEEVSTGASNDLEQATKLARAMVTKYGMSSRVGQLSIPYNSVLSPETRAEVEKEVNSLLAEAYTNAKNILKAHEKELHMLAKELLDKETLTGEQIRELLGRGKGGSKAAAA